MASQEPNEVSEFTKHSSVSLSLEEEVDDPLRNLERSDGSPSCTDVPDKFEKERLKSHLATILDQMSSPNNMIRAKALEKCSDLLKEIQQYPSVELPLLPRLVMILCLCSLDKDTGCDKNAARVLCQLGSIMRRKEDTLISSCFSQGSVQKTLSLMTLTDGSIPAILRNDEYVLVRVFGTFLSPEELMEAMVFLSGDLGAAEYSFEFFDIYRLLRQLIRQFSSKIVKVQTLLGHFFEKSKKKGGKNVALLAIAVLASENVVQVVDFLLKNPFSTCQEHWQMVFAFVDPVLLIEVLLYEMQGKPGELTSVAHATQAMRRFLSDATCKEKVRKQLPKLLMTVLGQISVSLKDSETVREPLEILQLLSKIMGTAKEETECWDQLSSPEHFSKGLSSLIRILLDSPHCWVPDMVDFLLHIIGEEVHSWLYEAAVMFYFKLLLSRVKEVEINVGSTDSLLQWLDHDNLGVRKLSLRGISSLILDSDLMKNPWCIQLALFNQLGRRKPGSLLKVMDVLETNLSSISGEEAAAYVKMLSATYSALIEHEEASVRAVAIKHLWLLRRRKGKRWLTHTKEAAISELVNVIIHLADESEVAEEVKAYLRVLVPTVRWYVKPENQNIHLVLHHVAKHLTKTYSTDLIRGAALSCMLHPCVKEAAIFKVAACFVGHLAHVNGSFIRKEDLVAYSTWLLNETYDDEEEEEARLVGVSTMSILHRVFREHNKRGLQGFVSNCAKKCTSKRKYPLEYSRKKLMFSVDGSKLKPSTSKTDTSPHSTSSLPSLLSIVQKMSFRDASVLKSSRPNVETTVCGQPVSVLLPKSPKMGPAAVSELNTEADVCGQRLSSVPSLPPMVQKVLPMAGSELNPRESNTEADTCGPRLSSVPSLPPVVPVADEKIPHK